MSHCRVPFVLLACALAQVETVCAQGFTELVAPLGFPTTAMSTGEFGSGICVADFNGDGLLDVVVAPPTGGAFRCYLNVGGMQFVDASAASMLGAHGQAACMQSADIDNDGDQDIFVGGTFEAPKLFVNNGAAVFSEEAAARGLSNNDDSYGASFGDFDRDGWLDLAVANRILSGPNGASNRLYRNSGDGYFVEVTAAAGLTTQRYSYCLTFMDFDEDLWPDLVEINDRGVVYGGNEIWRNNGDGTFSPKGTQLGADQQMDGMCVDFLDVFNDGGVDFFVTDTPTDHLFLLYDSATTSYTNETWTYGLLGGTSGWCANFLDYDNDGWQDLYVVMQFAPNLLYRNPAAPAAAATPWPIVSPALGMNQVYTQYTAAAADLDNDGDVDIVNRYHVSPFAPANGLSLHRNDVPGGNWIKLDLEGTRSNRDGLGAQVELTAGGRTQRQHCRSGVGFLSDTDKRLHFGLGAATVVDRITIRWPSGQVQFLTDVAANAMLDVVEPRMEADGTVAVGGSTTVTASIPGDEGLVYVMPLSLGVNNGVTFPDGRRFPLDQDSVLDFTIDPFNPIFVGSFGLLDAQGRGTATFLVPPLPWLSGLTVYSAALTLDPPNFPLIRTIVSEPATITIQ